MGMDMVPYTFRGEAVPDFYRGALPDEGRLNVVHFTLQGSEDLRWLIDKFEVWFADREDIAFLSSGVTHNGDPFIVMGWFESQIDAMFLDIMRNDPDILDFSVFTYDVDIWGA